MVVICAPYYRPEQLSNWREMRVRNESIFPASALGYRHIKRTQIWLKEDSSSVRGVEREGGYFSTETSCHYYQISLLFEY